MNYIDPVLNYLNQLGAYLTPYLSDISTALIACLLVMFGSNINRAMRAGLRDQHFIIRTIAFIALNAFGYGLLIIKVSPLLSDLLQQLEPGITLSIVLATFVFIGGWAQRHRQV